MHSVQISRPMQWRASRLAGTAALALLLAAALPGQGLAQPVEAAAIAPAEPASALTPIAAHALSEKPEPQAPPEATPEFAAAMEAAQALGGQKPVDAQALIVFYQGRDWAPAWVTAQGMLTPRATAALKVLAAARTEGLDPRSYDVGDILTATRTEDAGAALARDVLVSDSLLRYGRDLKTGRLDPRSVRNTYFERRGFDTIGLLERLSAAEDGQLATVLAEQRPSHPDYEPLRQALQRELRGESDAPLPTVAFNGLLRPGKSHEAVPQLRRRMIEGGWFDATATARDRDYKGPQRKDVTLAAQDLEDRRYDDALAVAVKEFQTAHGLKVDGIVGPSTLTIMNGDGGERLPHILASMERLRWLPDTLPERRVWVNIPSYWLTAYDSNEPALEMKVIVGSEERKTPVFSHAIQYIEFNPTWTVPPTIARKDFLPALRRDPGYLDRRGITLYAGWNRGGGEISPWSVDWNSVSPSSLGKYRMMQKPGPDNALGQVKFMFPNEFDVYLHDTSTPSKFSEAVRLLSSGCVRVAEPWKLSEFLLSDNERYKNGGWEKVRDRGKTARVDLATDVPVFLAYQTATVAEDGQIQFHGDVYGLDTDVNDAFERQVADAEGKTPTQ